MIINDLKNILIFTLVSFITFSVVVILLGLDPFLGFFLSLIIFGRLQIYYSEVLHEATHFNFVRSFKLNNIISNMLLYPFLLITVQQNRKSHFIHHSFKEGGGGILQAMILKQVFIVQMILVYVIYLKI